MRALLWIPLDLSSLPRVRSVETVGAARRRGILAFLSLLSGDSARMLSKRESSTVESRRVGIHTGTMSTRSRRLTPPQAHAGIGVDRRHSSRRFSMPARGSASGLPSPSPSGPSVASPARRPALFSGSWRCQPARGRGVADEMGRGIRLWRDCHPQRRATAACIME